MKKIIGVILICIMAFVFFGCNSGKDEEKLEGDLAQIDKEIITSDDVLEYMTLFAFSQGSSIADVTDETTVSYVMQMVLENMVEQKVQEHYLLDAGIDVLTSRQEEFDEFRENVLDDEEMAELYEQGDITDTGIEFLFRTQYYSSEFYNLIQKQESYSDEDLKEYYDDHLEDMQRTIVDAAHIMVTDLDLANDIYDQIVNQGADFAELAKEYSADSNTKDNGGELGEFGKNETISAFEDAVFSMEIGEISKPVLTDYVYHIIKLNNKYKKQLDYDICKSYIEDILISQACNEILDEKINSTVKYLYK